MTALFFLPITSWDALCPLPDLECDEILLLHYFPEKSTTCLVLAGGDLVVVREEPSPGEERIEIVGSVDAGITAAAWAPDEELLAVVTRADTVILMSRDFEPVNEATLTSDDLKASKHVSVGWGKKETQFQGKRAKTLRDPTMPEKVDEGKLSVTDDLRTNVSWRGDGAFLAINSIVSGNRRVIRVLTRDGVLDGVSEPVDNLESGLSWKPSGNLIASTQRLEDCILVVLFERNGLRHGQFPLRLSKEDMASWGSSISLTWNLDSSVLAICFRDRVQFWTTGNYHYYLKQEMLSVPKSPSSRALLQWHSEKPLKCSILTGASLLSLEYDSTVSRGSTVQPHDLGIVAVIDGKTLKLTPLKYAGVPPPMSLCDITASDNILDCSINCTGRKVAILTNTTIEIFEWEFGLPPSNVVQRSRPSIRDPRPTVRTTKLAVYSLNNVDDLKRRVRFTQVVVNQRDTVFALAPAQYDEPSFIRAFSSNSKQEVTNDEVAQYKDFSDIQLNDSIQNLLIDTECRQVWLQTRSDTTSFDTTFGQDDDEIHLPGGQSQSAVFSVSKRVGDSTKPNIHDQEALNNTPAYCKVSLTRRGELVVNDRVIARGCTSFLLTDAHLIFTTTQHLIKFVHLTKPDLMEIPADTPEADERCRSIERGARLVTSMPSIYAVVLQMPRGNLETIYPRVLVLSGVRRHILAEDYKAAFLACQAHQVDLNILHDFRPDLFMAKMPLFLSQIKKVSRIDEFLSKLKDEDVTQTLYKDTLKGSADNDAATPGATKLPNGTTPGFADSQKPKATDKVNRICDAFISILDPTSTNQIRNIITAHVSKRPPDLTAALTLVASLRASSEKETDDAVSHLCFLSDSNRLYDTALAIYDLELALLVAQHAQRDPREYMPFLQSLHALPPLRRQYQIDNHLRNFSKALTSLHALSAHDEVESYAIKHNLYTTALDLYKYDQSHYNSMTRLYATHLASVSQHASAATLYESLGDHTSAYSLYALAHHWRESLTCATLIPLPPSQIRTLALSLAATCTEESRDYRSAATIHLDYLSDIPTAARLLCRGSYFADALRLLALHNLHSQVAGIVNTGLTEKFGEILELLADCKSQLAAQVPRILELRVKKAEDPLAFFGGDPSSTTAADAIDIPDNVSLAATDASTAGGGTLFTRYGSNASKFGGTVASHATRKTSKTRRREERKRARGKKGSVYEEEYLVGSVARLIERINGVQDEVGRLVAALMRRGAEGRERAAVVAARMLEIGTSCQEARDQVWNVAAAAGGGDAAVEGKPAAATAAATYGETRINVDDDHNNLHGGGRPSGADGVFWESQMEMQEQMAAVKAPEVKLWKSPALLGA